MLSACAARAVNPSWSGFPPVIHRLGDGTLEDAEQRLFHGSKARISCGSRRTPWALLSPCAGNTSVPHQSEVSEKRELHQGRGYVEPFNTLP